MIDPRTAAHITQNDTTPIGVYRCGCENRIIRTDGNRRWFLCQFHEGYEAGLERAETP